MYENRYADNMCAMTDMCFVWQSESCCRRRTESAESLYPAACASIADLGKMEKVLRSIIKVKIVFWAFSFAGCFRGKATYKGQTSAWRPYRNQYEHDP